MSLNAGRLRHRIQIQHLVTQQDPGTGEMQEGVWVEFARVYAAIESLSTRDLIAAKAGQSEISARILIRYRSGILPTMRIVHGATVYSIEGQPMPDKDSGLEYLTVPVSAGVRDG